VIYKEKDFCSWRLEPEQMWEYYDYGLDDTREDDPSIFIYHVAVMDDIRDGYIQLERKFSRSFYIPFDYLDEMLIAASNKSRRSCDYYWGPAIRKNNIGNITSDEENIFGAKSVWVNIGNADPTIPFYQRKKEANTLLANFKRELKKYNITPHFIVSTVTGFTVFFVFENIFFPPFTDWYNIQRALSKMAGGNTQQSDITELVYIPNSHIFQNCKYRKIKIIQTGYYHERNYLGDFNKYYISDFKNILQNYI